MMNTHPHRHRLLKRRAELVAWQQAIDRLAMQICPLSEWEKYMQQVHQLEWRRQHTPQAVNNISIFPAWKKYREQARQVATLYQAIPLFQHLPLRWACTVGHLIFQ